MNLQNPEWVGCLAALFTTLAYLPQAVKVILSRDTRAISLGMYGMMTVGVALWLAYGILVDKPSVIAANGFTLVLSSLILLMKLRLG